MHVVADPKVPANISDQYQEAEGSVQTKFNVVVGRSVLFAKHMWVESPEVTNADSEDGNQWIKWMSNCH